MDHFENGVTRQIKVLFMKFLFMKPNKAIIWPNETFISNVLTNILPEIPSIDSNTVTVGGFSSGACFATQVFAFSGVFQGRFYLTLYHKSFM